MSLKKYTTGPCYLGAFYEHKCPDCNAVVSGVGESRCPDCADKAFQIAQAIIKERLENAEIVKRDK